VDKAESAYSPVGEIDMGQRALRAEDIQAWPCYFLPAQEGQMSTCLRRRDFIAGLGGAAAWPFATRAQQQAIPVVAEQPITHAADLVRRKVSVIYTTGGPSPALAAKAATDSVPIVFRFGGDPVAAGLVPA
jgi:hypothetical protein